MSRGNDINSGDLKNRVLSSQELGEKNTETIGTRLTSSLVNESIESDRSSGERSQIESSSSDGTD